jgi:hypothetical protein
LQVPGEQGHGRAKKEHLAEIPAAFFFQNVLLLRQQK